jgi:hypothetical protein
MTGAEAKPASVQAIRAKYPDLAKKLPPLSTVLDKGEAISYTQWEAWLALYHGKMLSIAKADAVVPRGPNYTPTDGSRAAQLAHLARLREVGHYPVTFMSPDDLAKRLLVGPIVDLMANDKLRRLINELYQGRHRYPESEIDSIPPSGSEAQALREEAKRAVQQGDHDLAEVLSNSAKIAYGSDFLIIGQPKSGKTFFKYFLSRKLQDIGNAKLIFFKSTIMFRYVMRFLRLFNINRSKITSTVYIPGAMQPSELIEVAVEVRPEVIFVVLDATTINSCTNRLSYANWFELFCDYIWRISKSDVCMLRLQRIVVLVNKIDVVYRSGQIVDTYIQTLKQLVSIKVAPVSKELARKFLIMPSSMILTKR